MFRAELFRKVTIIGVGLIGGSLGMAIKKNNLAREVVGVSQRNTSLVYALKNKTIDRGFEDVTQAVNNADLVVLATPVNTIVHFLSTIGPHLKRNCIVTDVGSTKCSIVEAAQKFLPNPSFFVGSHPLAGSDKAGAAYANPQLFENSLCIMTPTDQTNRLARDKVKQFWTQVGAKVKMLSAEEHDQILAFISHLPHLAVYTLMETIPDEFLQYAAQGLKDTTRIAASSPKMWSDISLANSKHIVKALDALVKNASSLRKAILSRNEKEIIDQFQKAKDKRDNLSKDQHE